MPGFDTLPIEIVGEIALHLPSVVDVLSLCSVSHYFDSALATPAIYCRRVSLCGWDVEAWVERYPMKDGTSEVVSQWRKIDYLHERLEQSLVKATGKLWPDPESLNPDEATIYSYLELVDLLVPIIAHAGPRNLDRLCRNEYHKRLSMILHVLDKACFKSSFFPTSTKGSSVIERVDPKRSTYMWAMPDPLQRAVFNFTSMLCSKNHMGHPLFKEALCEEWMTTSSRTAIMDVHPSSPRSEADLNRSFSICAISLANFWTCLASEQPRRNVRILPPSFFTAASAMHRNWLTSTAFPLRAVTEAGRRWVGFYSYIVPFDQLWLDPPMRITMTTSDVSSHAVTFRGEGQDSVGAFRISGRIRMDSGIVESTKDYEQDGPTWIWEGMLLPWGLVGRWGDSLASWGGWWWMWPENDR